MKTIRRMALAYDIRQLAHAPKFVQPVPGPTGEETFAKEVSELLFGKGRWWQNGT